MRRFWLATGVGLLALPCHLAAQVPPEIAARVRASGQAMDPSAGQLYAPLFAKDPLAGVQVTRDLAYGGDPLQKLDIYAPAGTSRKLPVLLFVHGGGFVRGDKHGAFYPDNITVWGARNHMVGVNIDYRLAPKDSWPAAAKDLGAAIAWVRANIARYGGDPNRIILWGHSAGANHVTDYLAHPEVRGAEAKAVKGAVLLSAFYPATPGDGKPHAYYGSDQQLQSLPNVIAGLERNKVPLFIANAEFDPEAFRLTGRSTRDTLCQSTSRCPSYVDLKDHNHYTEGMAVGTSDRSLTEPLLRWIERLR
jgi:triacylglycerol lipase